MSASDRQADRESIPGGATLRCATFHYKREKFKERDRQTDRETDRDREKKTETERHRERQKQRETGQHQQQQKTLGSLALLISKANLSPKRVIVWLVQRVARPERSVTFANAVWR